MLVFQVYKIPPKKQPDKTIKQARTAEYAKSGETTKKKQDISEEFNTIGANVIAFEQPIVNFSDEKTLKLIKNYEDFISSAIKILDSQGFNKCENINDLIALWDSLGSLLWSNYTYKSTVFLIDGLSKGNLDCDSSCYPSADVLLHYGLKSEIVSLSGHAVLKVSFKNKDVAYIETTINFGMLGVSILSEQAFRKKYPRDNEIYGLSPQYNSRLYDSRAWAYLDKGNYAMAEKDYNRALELNPRDTEAYDNLAFIHLSLGDDRAAIKDCSSAIEINPNDITALTNRGMAYDNLGKFKLAEKDFKKVLELDPTDKTALRRLHKN